MAQSQQRLLILEEIKQSFIEEMFMTLPQRERNLRTGLSSPMYVYGLSIWSRIPYFSKEIIGKELNINDFPELKFVKELNNYEKQFDTEIDPSQCIKYIDEAIKYNKQWN